MNRCSASSGVGVAFGRDNPAIEADRAAVAGIVAAARSAGDALREGFDPDPRPRHLQDILRLMGENDAISLGVLCQALRRQRPDTRWVEDEQEAGALPPGEWWVTDPVEGNINKAHGMVEFSVTATLVRNNKPVITVVHLPLAGDTYTAVAGGGAFQNGRPLRVSAKTELSGAFGSTSQNGGNEAPEPSLRIGRSVTAMLDQNTIVRVAPPPTLQLVQVAAGRMDLFWQFSAMRSGLLAGALLVAEAGGTVTDTRGGEWALNSDDFLAATPALHAQAVAVLSGLR